MSIDNKNIITSNLIKYANDLELILFDFAKCDIFFRNQYERQIQNLAQLSINNGIDIDDIAKEINQEKQNEKIRKGENLNKSKDKNEIEINNISSQIFCKDFYNNLYQFLKRKKESLKIINLFNVPNNKNIYGTNNVNNKYKNQNEQNISYDNKKNTVYIPTESKSSGSKYIGKKRKSK